MNYYNEFDPKAAAWLRELIAQGHIPVGDVDERSITEVKAHELAKYTQCHFFAGIGGWSLALKLAGWPDTEPVGTGSCPCQPFSTAGSGKGVTDERHLWPVFFKLIIACRALGQRWTDAIFGEQVEAAINHGWLDSLSADLEGEGYAVGEAVLGAHSIGAPHRRQRLYWVAYNQGEARLRVSGAGGENGVALGNAHHEGPQGRRLRPVKECDQLHPWTRDVAFIACTDGRKRLVKSGIQPLAHGLSGRVGLLRGSGNAIVPQVAATFIEAAELARTEATT